MRIKRKLWAILAIARAPGASAFLPRLRPPAGRRGQPRHYEHSGSPSTREPYHSRCRRLGTTIHSCRRDGEGQQQQQYRERQQQSMPVPSKELVLREFTMPLQADPAAYESRVRAECLRDGGETATIVRWHISRADEETGKAFVEAVFLAPSKSGAASTVDP